MGSFRRNLPHSIAPAMSGCSRTAIIADGPYWKRTGSFAAEAGRLAPAFTRAGSGTNVVRLKGSVEADESLLGLAAVVRHHQA